jgi:hypothetical protein
VTLLHRLQAWATRAPTWGIIDRRGVLVTGAFTSRRRAQRWLNATLDDTPQLAVHGWHVARVDPP